MTLETPLAELSCVPPLRARQLERFGLRVVGDLLLHFPRRHEDRRAFDHFPTGSQDAPVCVCGVVRKTSVRRIRGFQKMFDVLLEEEDASAFGGRLICRWFNSHWVEKMIVQGHRLVVFGKAKISGTSVVITHPEFEVVEDDADASIHLKRIVPVHPATEGLSPRIIRRIIWDVLEELTDDDVTQLVPAKLDRTSRAWALRQMHFPESWESLAKAKQHLVLEEFLAMQLAIATKRREHSSERGAAHCGPGELMRRLHEALPFSLTAAQQRAIAGIREDLSAPRAMNRLLHGDVGSGKTLVAMSAMLLCVEAGWQAALMAPTQILAEQHYLVFRRLLDPLGIRVAIRTGARREDAGAMPLFNAAKPQVPGGAPDSGAVSGDPPETPLNSPGSQTTPESPSAPDAQFAGAHYRQGRLPHFEYPWAIYAICFNTLDPARLSPAACDIVMEAIVHWANQRYHLFAACVMPDHVHLLIQPIPKPGAAGDAAEFFPLSEIMHSIKSWTAHEINKLEGGKGSLWQKEWFDRYTCGDRDLAEKYDYILNNPRAEGLVQRAEDYAWSWWEGGGWRRKAESKVALEAGRLDQHPSRVLHPGGGAVAPQQSAPCPASAIAGTEPHILIGTHALLYEGAGFTRLGLAVVDEQHKFGVMQRARLRAQAGEGAVPDVLVMTATPIPRTLTMTLYGDLDISTLDEMPAGRGRIITGIRPPAKLDDAARFIREQLDAGRQAYIVYPLIEDSGKLEAKAATAEFKKWSGMLSPHRCELIHGRIPPEDKEAIMERFRSGEAKALIATTVIEVGVDVPNATVMLIENAERFGLAQIHQLRGRIGRGTHTSYCILFTSSDDKEVVEKLRILEQTTNGFEIAEADLRLRGPGDMLGTAQSGLPPLRLGDLVRDADLMKLARNHAFLIFEHDPQLERPEHAGCRELLAASRRLNLAQVS